MKMIHSCVGVAQLDRAFGYGPKGRGFESSRPRFQPLAEFCKRFFYYILKMYVTRFSNFIIMLTGGNEMEKIKINCAVCNNQCQMEVEIEDDEVVDVTGNGCMKGYIYAQNEALVNMHK